jgi:hypothetical protein
MKPPRTFALLSGAASILTGAVLLSGCSSPGPQPSATPVLNFQHIHELVAAPGGGALLVGTHVGLYRLSIGSAGSARAGGPIGGLDFDPMGFTIAGGVAYASGHPGPTTPKTFGSPDLGLITSTNLGQSWHTLSLAGVGDFHGLAVMTAGGGPVRVFGYDSTTQRLQRSLDGGTTWTSGPSLVARDLLTVGGLLYATTPDGLAVSRDQGETFHVDAAAPVLYLIAAAENGALAGVDVNGSIWSQSPGQSWVRGGSVIGTGQALAVVGHRIYVADDRGIALTDNGGASWLVLKVHK